VVGGEVRFDPRLLRAREFVADPRPFRYLDVDGQWCELTVPASALAFTWCQVPLIYRLDDSARATLSVEWDDGNRESLDRTVLPSAVATQLFSRSGKLRQLELVVGSSILFSD
jgi:hypothetical protein